MIDGSLSVFHRSARIADLPLGRETPSGSVIAVDEQWPCSFVLAGPKPGWEYDIRIGNVGISSAPIFPDAVGDWAYAVGDQLIWPESPAFESARGRTIVELRGRPEGLSSWSPLARLEVMVAPSKLGDERYYSMLVDLRRLGWGLVFDLVSKSTGSVRQGAGTGLRAIDSHQLELRLIARLWERLAPLLRGIVTSPAASLGRIQARRLCWGSERIGARGLANLATLGIDPRWRTVPRPFPALVEELREHTDIYEHRVIARFLDELLSELDECIKSVDRQTAVIASQRSFRDHRVGGMRSLYDREDVPRLERLKTAKTQALGLRRGVAAIRSEPIFGKTEPDPIPRQTPLFENDKRYRRARILIEHHYDASSTILEEGMDDHLKATWRMYEHWVFLQLVSAIRILGFSGVSARSLVQRIAKGRFSLDLERGASIEFRSSDERVVRMRYEPWILTRDEAAAAGESIFRPGGGPEWSPDVLIEVFRGGHRETRRLQYAIVVDAKYSNRIVDRQWDATNKYLQIQSVQDRKPIVRQVWIAHPSTNDTIECRDPTILWSTLGPDIGSEESVHGRLSLTPTVSPESRGHGQRPESSVVPSALRFMGGILTFLGFPEAVSWRPAVSSSVGTSQAS